MSSTKRYSYLLLTLAVYAADAASKKWAVAALAGQPPIVLAPFLQLIYVENTGAAFGILAGGGEWVKWLLLGFALAVSLFVLNYMRHTDSRFELVGCALILGGAAGNIHDRIRLGYVVDFIDAHWEAYHWPAFNIADSAISAAVVMLLWHIFFARQPMRENGESEKN